VVKKLHWHFNYLKKGVFILTLWSPALLFINPDASAQNKQASNAAHDSGWVEHLNDQIIFKLALENTSKEYSVDTDFDDYVLRPNPSEVMCAYFSYRFISFFVNYVPRFLPGNNDEANKGKSKGGGLGISFSAHQWFHELSYSKTRGYYLRNTKDFVPGWQPGDPYLVVPDLQSISFEGVTGYNTNPKLSLSAISSQTERQLKSTGAFIPKLSYRYYIIDDKSGGTTQKSTNLQLQLGAGYHHTFTVKERLYFSGSFTPYFGYIFTKLLTRDPAGNITTNTRSPVYQWDARIGVGYNAQRFFFGSYFTTSSSKYTQGMTTAVNEDIRLFLQVFAGFRLSAPKFIKKAYDKIL
jgi:hypothetical protein